MVVFSFSLVSLVSSIILDFYIEQCHASHLIYWRCSFKAMHMMPSWHAYFVCQLSTWNWKVDLPSSEHLTREMEEAESFSSPSFLQDVSNRVSERSSGDDESSAVAQLRKLLFRRMLIGVSDGRFFLGTFHCIDKQGNIILQDAVEYRNARPSPSPMDQRCLGLILIPASCRTSCHAECSTMDEQISLLSIDKW